MMFSILIPAYNVENYISRCLDSILEQRYTDFEVVIIDDGSIDNTLSICKVYAGKDNRIHVYHQINSGVAAARNFALDKAKGEWIVFIDADDYVESNYLESFYKSILLNPDIDVVVCGYFIITPNEIKERKQFYLSKQEYLLKILQGENVATTLWAKAIRKELVEKHKIKFLPSINMGEDLCFLSISLYYSKDVCFLRECLYYWNHANTNSMTSNSNKYVNDIECYSRFLFHFFKNNDYEIYKKAITARLLKTREYVYMNTHHVISLPMLDQKLFSWNARVKNFLIECDYYRLFRLYRRLEYYVTKFFSTNKKV